MRARTSSARRNGWSEKAGSSPTRSPVTRAPSPPRSETSMRSNDTGRPTACDACSASQALLRSR